MLDETYVHPPGVATCRPCPIESCGWHHDEQKSDGWTTAGVIEPDADAIAQCGGDAMQAAIYATVHDQMLRVDDILRAHFETHALEEWVTEVVRLRSQLAAARPPDTTPGDALRADRTASTSDVARALGVGSPTVQSYARQGRIPFGVTPGGHRRFNLDEVRDALRAERKAAR